MADGAGTAGDAGTQGTNTQGEGAGAAANGPDIGALAQTLEGQGQTLEGMRETLAALSTLPDAFQALQGGEPEAEPEGYDLSFLDSGPQDETAQIAAGLAGLMEQQDQRTQEAWQQALTSAVSPLQEKIDQLNRQREADLLMAEFDELGDPETAQATVKLAEQMAQQMGSPDLAAKPGFWRMAFLAAKGMEAAKAEGEGSPNAVTLEGAGGAGPGGGEQDPVALIMGAGGSKSVLPFG